MEAAEMKILRKDEIRNEYIKGTVTVEQLEMKMKQSRLRWYGHVMGRYQEYVGRRVMKMELPIKRKRGKPKRRFLVVVKEDKGKVGARDKTLKTRRFGETSYAVATLDQR